MKPDKKTCLYCGKEIEGKKLYCDDAHRMAFKRQSEQEPEQTTNPNTNKAEQIVPEQQVEHESEQDIEKTPEQLEKERHALAVEKAKEESKELREQLNKTDRTFLDRAVNEFEEPYYRFELDNVREGSCGQCNAKFKTTLSLNKYCSYRHYQEALGK